MPGTFNGTTLTISATPVDGALIPDKSATNVAGIAIVGSDMYCVKTTGLKTTLLKTTDYMATKATAVKKDIVLYKRVNLFVKEIKLIDYFFIMQEQIRFISLIFRRADILIFPTHRFSIQIRMKKCSPEVVRLWTLMIRRICLPEIMKRQ